MDKEARILELEAAAYKCKACDLLATCRSRVVFGYGNINAELMIISDGPTAEEDSDGFALTGKAAQNLDDTLKAAGVNMRDTYITNMIMCRAVSVEQGKKSSYLKDRDPSRDELKACRERLEQEIYTVDPKLILLLGTTSASLVTHLSLQSIAGTYQKVKIPGKTEKTVISYPAIATYHPRTILDKSGNRAMGTIEIAYTAHVHLVARMLRVAKEMARNKQQK